jgi:hypothetical protein
MGIIENIQNNIVVMYEIQVRTGEWRRGFFFCQIIYMEQICGHPTKPWLCG